MKLNKEDELLANSLLNEVAGNIATLQGKAATAINGKPVNDIDLISDSINQLHTLLELIKGDD